MSNVGGIVILKGLIAFDIKEAGYACLLNLHSIYYLQTGSFYIIESNSTAFDNAKNIGIVGRDIIFSTHYQTTLINIYLLKSKAENINAGNYL